MLTDRREDDRVQALTASNGTAKSVVWQHLDLNVGDGGGFLVHALHDSREDLARAELVAHFIARGHQLLHRRLPLHWRSHLLRENLLDHGGIRVCLGVHVGDDGYPGLGDLDLVEHLLERRYCRRHEVRVERTRHRELDGHARLEFRLRELTHFIDGGHRARGGIVSGAEVVSDGDLLTSCLARRRAKIRHLVRVEADHRHHAG
mmetsp:Transcript_22949/g.58386  ORF Transcript_22949/g.58386 Transcript_22949/m.58386 type:complete len:204 (-) Transcript_22949:585-1196(-)